MQIYFIHEVKRNVKFVKKQATVIHNVTGETETGGREVDNNIVHQLEWENITDKKEVH